MKLPIHGPRAGTALNPGDKLQAPSGRHVELVAFIAGRCRLRYLDDGTEVLLLQKLLKPALESPILRGAPDQP